MLLGQADGPEGQGMRFLDHAAGRQDHLETAPADVDDRGGAVAQREVLPDAAKGQLGLFVLGDHLQTDARLALRGPQELLAVSGFAHGRGGDGPDLLHSHTFGERTHPIEGLDGASHGLLAQRAGPIEAFSEACLRAFLVEHAVRRRAVHLRHHEANGVGADVDGGESGRRLSGFHA